MSELAARVFPQKTLGDHNGMKSAFGLTTPDQKRGGCQCNCTILNDVLPLGLKAPFRYILAKIQYFLEPHPQREQH